MCSSSLPSSLHIVASLTSKLLLIIYVCMHLNSLDMVIKLYMYTCFYFCMNANKWMSHHLLHPCQKAIRNDNVETALCRCLENHERMMKDENNKQDHENEAWRMWSKGNVDRQWQKLGKPRTEVLAASEKAWQRAQGLVAVSSPLRTLCKDLFKFNQNHWTRSYLRNVKVSHSERAPATNYPSSSRTRIVKYDTEHLAWQCCCGGGGAGSGGGSGSGWSW